VAAAPAGAAASRPAPTEPRGPTESGGGVRSPKLAPAHALAAPPPEGIQGRELTTRGAPGPARKRKTSKSFGNLGFLPSEGRPPPVSHAACDCPPGASEPRRPNSELLASEPSTALGQGPGVRSARGFLHPTRTRTELDRTPGMPRAFPFQT